MLRCKAGTPRDSNFPEQRCRSLYGIWFDPVFIKTLAAQRGGGGSTVIFKERDICNSKQTRIFQAIYIEGNVNYIKIYGINKNKSFGNKMEKGIKDLSKTEWKVGGNTDKCLSAPRKAVSFKKFILCKEFRPACTMLLLQFIVTTSIWDWLCWKNMAQSCQVNFMASLPAVSSNH